MATSLTNKEILLKQVLKDTQRLLERIMPVVSQPLQDSKELRHEISKQYAINASIIAALERRSYHGKNDES